MPRPPLMRLTSYGRKMVSLICQSAKCSSWNPTPLDAAVVAKQTGYLPLSRSQSDSGNQSGSCFEQAGIFGLQSILLIFWQESMDQVWEFIKNCSERIVYYEIDGIIIKVNDLSVKKSWALLSRHLVGHRLQVSSRGKDQLLSVDWTVGRTGVVTPTANLTPVQLAGTTVSRRATLHNVDYIQEKIFARVIQLLSIRQAILSQLSYV